MQQPVEPPLSSSAILATPYLVTNGEVDEEVQVAIRGLNAFAASQQRPTLQLITRGALLKDWIGPIANEVWPSATDVDRHILQCWGLDGGDFLPPERFHEMILAALQFDDPPRSVATLSRTLYGAAIINEICLRRYVEANNYVSAMFGRVLFLAAAYALIEKSGLAPASFQPLRETIWRSLADDYVSLLSELETKKARYYYDHEVHLEFVYHQSRLFMLQSIVAIMALALEKQPLAFRHVAEQLRVKNAFVREFIDESPQGVLSGEYVIPQLLFIYRYRCCSSGSCITERYIVFALKMLLQHNAKDDRSLHLPNPYHLMPDVLEGMTDRVFGLEPRYRRKQSFRHQLWTALGLFGLLVRRNLKVAAKSFFPDMTRFIHRKTVLSAPWAAGLFRCDDQAQELGERLPFPSTWAQFVERTKSPSRPCLPSGLSEDFVSLALFLILCPFRMTEEVTYFLDELLVGNWHK
jgi:hypothetical protein